MTKTKAVSRVLGPMLALTVVTSLGVGPTLAQDESHESPVALGEPPQSLAVADSGVTLAALADVRQAAIISPDGDVRRVDIACQPISTAISPSGDTGWILCQDSSNLRVVDLQAGTISTLDSGVELGTAVSYVAKTGDLVVGGMRGQVHVFNTNRDYQEVRRISIPEPVLEMTVSPDGRRAFSASEAAGILYRFDLSTGSSKRLEIETPMFATSLEMSPTGTTLYMAGGWSETSPEDLSEGIVALNPVTGAQKWLVPITIESPGWAIVDLVAGSRTLFVGTSMAASVGFTTYFFGLQLDPDGRVADTENYDVNSVTVAALAGSENGQTIAIGGVDRNLWRIGVDDPPYPGEASIEGTFKARRLMVSGMTRGIAAGTTVTVYVKNLAAKRPRFIAQKARAVVGGDGRINWRTKTDHRRVQVYVKAGSVKSPRITIERR